MKNWKCEYLLIHATNVSVWFTTAFYECVLIIERIYDDRIPPKCPQKLRKFVEKKENLKMGISTKPFYKLFSVVHNYFLWMCLIIERIYDDRIASKCPQKLRNLRKMKTWKREYLLIHAINFSVSFTTAFYECVLIIERIYDDRIPPKCHQKLRKFAKKGKPENWEYLLKPFYKLFSVVHNYFMWMCVKSLRGYMMIVSPPKCPQKLIKFAKIWKTENVNIY